MEADIFKEEAFDLLDDIEATLLELKDAPDDRELINRLFRAFHTIKGSGAMFGFKAVSEFTHQLENVIDKIRDGSGVFPDELTEVLLAGRDQILRMIEAPDPDAPEIAHGAREVLALLAGTLGQPTVPPPRPAAAPPAVSSPPPPAAADERPAATAPQPTPALIEEINELLAEAEQMLQKLRSKPDSAKLANRLHRAFRTVAGTAEMYEMVPLAEFSGTIAEALEAVRQQGKPVDAATLSCLEAARSHVLSLLRAPEPGAQLLHHRSTKLVADLKALCNATPAGGEKTAEPLKVLIVEDEFISRYLLQEFLTPYGNSHVAIDGYEAVLAVKNALIEKRPYHLVCLDIMMPGIDGRQVAKEIRRLESEMGSPIVSRVVMTSAIDDLEVKESLLKAGHCDAYLVKPLRFDDLTELLRKYFPEFGPADA